MLVARFCRVTPGRPEGDLGYVKITPRESHRTKNHGRFDATVICGPANERDEQHVYVPAWDVSRPAVDLLEHVLTLARVQRSDVAGPDTFVVPADLMRVMVDALMVDPSGFSEDHQRMLGEIRANLEDRVIA